MKKFKVLIFLILLFLLSACGQKTSEQGLQESEGKNLENPKAQVNQGVEAIQDKMKSKEEAREGIGTPPPPPPPSFPVITE